MIELLDSVSQPHFAVPEKNTTVRLDPTLRARAEDEARRRGWSVSSFGAWAIRQVIELEFLDTDNQHFVQELLANLGAPWSAFDVINALVGAARREVAKGRLRPMFWSGQIRTVAKTGEKQ
jgi:hypothetical protein